MKLIEKVISIICILWGLYSMFVEKSIPFEAIITFIGLFSFSKGYSKTEYNRTINKGKVTNNYHYNFKPLYLGIVLIIFVLLIKWNWPHIIHLAGKDKIFKNDNSKFEILILPFNQICRSEGKNYDAGFVIKDRLENISNDLNLNINVHYMNNIKTNDLTYNNAKDLRLYHNADIIIYGNLMTSDCSPSGDQICLNFQLDESYKFDQKSKNNYENANVDDLKNGKIQEEVEAIVLILTTISQIGISNDLKMSQLLQDQLSKIDNITDFSIFIELGDILLKNNYMTASYNLYNKAYEIILLKNNVSDMSKITITLHASDAIYAIDRINYILEHQRISNFGIGNVTAEIERLEKKLLNNPIDTFLLVSIAYKYHELGQLNFEAHDYCNAQDSYEKGIYYLSKFSSKNKILQYSLQFGVAKNMIQNREFTNCRDNLLKIVSDLGSRVNLSTNESRNVFGLLFELELEDKKYKEAYNYLNKIENLYIHQEINNIDSINYHIRHKQFYLWKARYYYAIEDFESSLIFIRKA
jgi:hypothetical protein